MARVYNLGTVIGVAALSATIVGILVAIVISIRETIHSWAKSVVTSKVVVGLIAVSVLIAFNALVRELDNWRITFEPRLRIWRATEHDQKP